MIHTPPLPEPIDSSTIPLDRYCDLVLDGGVINGVVYPGFLIEIARKFRFHAIGGTSVGAIAAALAAAFEYARRFNRDTGFNEGLRKLPENLSEIVDEQAAMTRIRSLFQPEPKLKPLFDFAVAWIASGVNRKSGVKEKAKIPLFYRHFPLTALRGSFLIVYAALVIVVLSLVIFCNPWYRLALPLLVCYPLLVLAQQLKSLFASGGYGMCSGMPFSRGRQALMEWLHEGIQKAAGLTYAKPLTFADLWSAPGGPKKADGKSAECSIDLRTITSCLSHGRAYELPIKDDANARIFFKLTELDAFFPKPVIAHLRRVAKPIQFNTDPLTRQYADRITELENQFPSADIEEQIRQLAKKQVLIRDLLLQCESSTHAEPNIRELPCADLPIIVAARMSLSVPILFKAIPMLGFNLGKQPEEMDLVRLWFSDGGISSNFPIHLFDSALPRWPTFGAKVMEEAPKRTGGKERYISFVPYLHRAGQEDILIEPKDESAFTALPKQKKQDLTSFGKFLYSIYQTGKDGTDRSYLRMPEVRNRVVQIFIENITGGALNLMIDPSAIRTLGCEKGMLAGRNIANAYLGQVLSSKYDWVSLWEDHRWVRFNLLVTSLRQYLTGFSASVNQVQDLPSLLEQIQQAQFRPPLQSENASELCLTDAQTQQMLGIVTAIQRLEQELKTFDKPIPYKPEPQSVLRIKPKL